MTMPPPPPVDPTPATYGSAPATFPGKTLGIVGLILAIFFSLIGLIVSIVARSQSKKAGFKNTPATIGIIIGIVLFVIQVFIVVGLIVAGISVFNSECRSLGSGTHTYSSGGTTSSISCP
jgi:succinate dehydrogenase/fumarate reductase cytochrome b subunit